MSLFSVKLTASEIGELGPADVVFVLMVHESNEAVQDYEQHVIQHLLPKLHAASFSNYEGIWGSDPEDFDCVTDILDAKGLLNTKFQCTMQRLNAGEGLTAVWIIMCRPSPGSS